MEESTPKKPKKPSYNYIDSFDPSSEKTNFTDYLKSDPHDLDSSAIESSNSETNSIDLFDPNLEEPDNSYWQSDPRLSKESTSQKSSPNYIDSFDGAPLPRQKSRILPESHDIADSPSSASSVPYYNSGRARFSGYSKINYAPSNASEAENIFKEQTNSSIAEGGQAPPKPSGERMTQHQTEQKKQYQLKRLNRQEREVLQQVAQKLNRPLSDTEIIDTIDYILYEPDRVETWLNNSDLYKAHDPAKQTALLSKKTVNSAKKVGDMSSLEKVNRTIELAILNLPEEQGNKLKSLFASKTLMGLVALLGVWSASQFLGVGEVVDAVVLLCGGAFLGWKTVAVFKNLIGFANSINAITSEELELAANHLVKLTSTVEINSLFTLFTKN